MAFFFGDGFDFYNANLSEGIGSFWDASSLNPGNLGVIAGRFTGSRAVNWSSATRMDKTSGVNDAVHHFSFAIYAQTISSTTAGYYVNLVDGAAVQCSFCFKNNGTVVDLILTSGATGTGTVLATYAGAFALAATWYQFEIEIVIHNTAGSFTVRKNGNPSNDFTLGSLNTRNGSTNNYANKIQTSIAASVTQYTDDFLWRSDVSSVPWVGDIRCYTRMPAVDSSLQWTPNGVRAQSLSGVGGNVATANFAKYSGFTVSTGTVTAATIGISSNYTGNIKCALYNDFNGQPGTVIASASNILVAPASGTQTFNWPPGTTVSAGKVWLAFCFDTSTGGTIYTITSATTHYGGNATYSSFPQASPVVASAGAPTSSLTIAPTNAGCVNEAQQDATATYVSSTVSGQADLYTIAAIPGGQPVTTLGVTTRAYAQKADAGTRNVGVQLKSGATVSSASGSSMALMPIWQWVSRTDTVDPNTGAAWTAGAVASLLVGPVVTA